jgi:tRNA A37 threonylcarbamoyladenosine biosynthesis protein TsaE
MSGDMRTMPGLSSHPAAERIDIDENRDIVGLFMIEWPESAEWGLLYNHLAAQLCA